MKKLLLRGAILILLVLDWAALDDITTGNEPNYYGEYAVLAFSALVFGFLLFLHFKRNKRDKE